MEDSKIFEEFLQWKESHQWSSKDSLATINLLVVDTSNYCAWFCIGIKELQFIIRFS
jgi:hypothetical protein